MSAGRAAHVQSGEIQRETIVSYGYRDYAIYVRPYVEAVLATLDGVVKRTDQLDAEWREFTQALATRLRRLRSEAGLSQEDVAYRAGLSRFIYQQYEKGESRRGEPANPTLRSVLAIAQVFGISIEVLLPSPVPDLHGR